MSVLGDKTGRANIRHVILTFIILLGLATAFLYYPPIPTRTAEELTHGDITFADISGNPISGAIGISGSGISGGYKENVNFIKWTKIPNGIIYFDALGIKNVSVKFRLGGDSRNSNVIIENYGAQLPKPLDEPAPGTPVKYVQVSAFNLSFVEAEISIKYNASELGDIDENSLNIYHYNRTTKAWSSIKTKIDAKDDILTASVDSLSIFAVSARMPGQIDIRDTGSTHVRSDIRTYDNARDLKKSGRSSSLLAQDIPSGGELEVDAITSKNVALRLKVNAATGGEVILDDYGRKNPVSAPLPGITVKFVEIGVQGISFSSAQVSVRYKEAELNGVSENSLVIYHWNGASWEALATQVDTENDIISAITTSLSPFGIASSQVGTAPGNASQLFVFTDRDVYLLGEPYDISSGGNTWGTTWVTGINVKVYAAILDDDGNMIRSLSGLSLNVTLKDNARYYHNASTTNHSDTQVSNGNWWNSFNTSFTDPDGDGIWEATFNLQDAEQKSPQIAQGVSRADQFNITVSVNETTRGLSKTTYVLFSRNACGHTNKNIGSLTAGEIHDKNSAHTQVACTVCHWGWEHKLGVHGNNTALGNDTATKPSITNTAASWNYNTGTEDGTATATYEDAGRADICVACHNSNKNYANILDMDTGTASTITDANNDTIPDNDRPSCSWAKGATSEGGWTSPGCHASGTGNITGTLIEKVPLMNSTTYFLNWSWDQKGPGKSYAHNRTYSRVACELCHGNHEVIGLPNQSASRTNINGQCWYCHNISGGYLNITSNGGTAVAHKNTDCKSCHKNSSTSKLDAHSVSQGVSGGVNCTSCHDIGGTAGYDVNFTAVNISMHGSLNNRSTSTGGNWTNKPCWACHGTKNGTWANESDQPANGHNASVYNKPRICHDCHNDTLALFGAGNVTDHIPSGISPYTDVNTSSYTNTYCSYCHNNSLVEAYDGSMGVSGGSPVNASVSHYGANRTAGRLMSTTSNSTDCVYCHRNSPNMQKWGILPGSGANISNKNASEGGSDHSTYTSSSNCPTCHGNYTIVEGFTFHNAALGRGIAGGIAGGPGCLGCHNTSTPQNNTGIRYIDGSSFSRSTHADMNANNASGYSINASCWACHNSTGTVVPDNTHPDRQTTPFVCTDCHLANGSRAGAYNATIISNHFKNGTAIRALDNRTSDIASCIECHENVSGMLLPNNDNDTGSFAGDNISVTGGSTSTYHYGKSQLSFGKTRGSNEYCLYCHRNGTGTFNSTFMYESNSSISNHSMRYNASNPSCGLVQCHNSTGETLHGSSLIMPGTVYNSSYCLNCHGLNSSSGTANYSGITTGTKTKHNNSVNCKECHMNDGKDIHPVKYLQPEGIFNTSNSTAVNCVLCHLTGIAGFLNASRIPAMHHSDDNNTGSVWNLTAAYWTNTSQQSMCNYCHGDSRHNGNALGRPANWSGLNIINSSIANNSNWCSGCHYQGYTSGAMNYNNMVLTFEGDNMPVPPEISNHSSYAPYGKNGYFNHTLSPDYSDPTCKECHGTLLPNGTRMDGFMHNVSTGTGTCTGCHYSYSYMSTVGAAAKFVNQSMYNSSAHGSLACEDCHTKGHKNIAARKACEDCHSYQADPINDRDRHNITGTPAQNVVNNTICTSCHDTGLYNNATAQYGYGKTYDCNYCHTYPDKTYS